MAKEDAGKHFVKFTRSAGERIARTVIGFERLPTSSSPLEYEHPTQITQKIFRVCDFGTQAWNVDTTAVVTLPNTTVTVSVLNVFGSLTTSSSSRKIGIAKDGTTWYLIQARCP